MSEIATSGTINNYKSGMALKFNVYDKDFKVKDPGGFDAPTSLRSPWAMGYIGYISETSFISGW